MHSPSLLRQGGLAAIFLGMVLQLAAQDAMVAPLVWLKPKDAPDTLPVLQKVPAFSFPWELEQTKEIGYAVAVTYIDETGKRLGFAPFANLEAYVDPAYDGIKQMSFAPGRRAGQPVLTGTQLTVIFNPKSAAVDAPDATPRLLAVTFVRVKKPDTDDPTGSFGKWVYADVSVDETGRVTAVRNVAPEWTDAFLRTAREWRFAPARRAGHPVAAEVHMPFLLADWGDWISGTGKESPPEVISRISPVYPLSMERTGISGSVDITFTVDREGRPKDMCIRCSLNAAFDDAAVDGLRLWKFKPALQDGVPVERRMSQRLTFGMQYAAARSKAGLDLSANGNAGLGLPRPGAQAAPAYPRAQLGDEVKGDVTSPQLLGHATPVYPYALLRDRETGRAKVRCVIGETGEIVSSSVIEATRPEFGHALQAAAEIFEYRPALKAGRPMPVEITFEQKFSLNDLYEVVASADKDMLKRESKHPDTILTPERLDKPLSRIVRRSVQLPTSMDQKTARGEAVVEILIDEDGHVRLPRVVSASQEALGYAAVQAVAGWRYDPPKAQGKPAVVRLRVPLNFNPSEPTPADI